MPCLEGIIYVANKFNSGFKGIQGFFQGKTFDIFFWVYLKNYCWNVFLRIEKRGALEGHRFLFVELFSFNHFYVDNVCEIKDVVDVLTIFEKTFSYAL